LISVWAGGLTHENYAAAGDPGSPCHPSTVRVEELVFGSAFANESITANDLYQIEAEAIGEGGFGVACSARHKTSGKQCVVKLVNKVDAGDDYRDAMHEAGIYRVFLTMTKETPHANVVQYYDFLESPQYYYVIMERLMGPELFDHLTDCSRVTEVYCRTVMHQVLSSIRHLHDTVGIFHRDVKLDNFRFRDAHNEDADIVLLDLGFARHIDSPWDRTIAGTLMYLAPEVARLAKDLPLEGEKGAGYSAPVDLWAAGIVLYILLVGQEPFNDEEVWALAGTGPDAAVPAKLLARAMQALAYKDHR